MDRESLKDIPDQGKNNEKKQGGSMKHDWVVCNEDSKKQPLVKCRTCGEKYRFRSWWGDGVDLREEWNKIRAMNDCDGPGLSPKQRSEILTLIHKYVDSEALKKETGCRLLLKSITEETEDVRLA